MHKILELIVMNLHKFVMCIKLLFYSSIEIASIVRLKLTNEDKTWSTVM